MGRSVVVTGLGSVNPLADNAADTWAAMLAGTSGVSSLPEQWIDEFNLPVHFAGQVGDAPMDNLKKSERRRMDRATQFAVLAFREAWAQAGAPEIDPERLAVSISSGIGGITTILDGWDTLRERGGRRLMPMTIPMLMPNAPAATISVELGARAGARSAVSACASGAEAVSVGMELITSGQADIVVTGGTEAAIHPLPIWAFSRMQALSTRNDDPQAASRPYDSARDGFVMGEGAGILVLEAGEHARARGAHIFAELAGFGITSDGYDVAPPDPSGQGQERAMRIALERAGVSAREIAHINAHATSTPVGDTIEAAAIARVCPDAWVSGTKSMTGHLLGGAGALEMVATVCAVEQKIAPPTINVDHPEDGLPIRLVRGKPQELASSDGPVIAMNNAFGFGGHNVAIVVRQS